MRNKVLIIFCKGADAQVVMSKAHTTSESEKGR